MNTKLKCLLLDDELPGLAYLKMICEQIPEVEVLRAFNDPLKFMEESEKSDFDFCILDIEMPGLNGLEVAKSIKGKPVIFTTAYKEYAAEAFDVDAIDYVRKPIEKNRLEKAVQKMILHLNETAPAKQYIRLNTNKGRALLVFDQILHITNSPVDKRDKLVVLNTGEELILKNISFEQLLSSLPSKEFCRISKKDLVAMKAVRFYSHNEVKLGLSDREITLALSDSFKKEFLTRLEN